MAEKTVSDILIDTLQAAGVRRVYGRPDDSLTSLIAAIRARSDMEFVPVRHEAAGALAAGAEASVTGGLAACVGACGSGSAQLLSGLYDCHRSRMPVLAIAAQGPSADIGTGYFPDIQPERLLQECSHYCQVIATPAQAVHLVESAVQAALGLGGVAVLVLPGDVAGQRAEAPAPRIPALGHSSGIVPAKSKIAQAAQLLNECNKITILAGIGCDSAHAELLQAAQALRAPVVHTLRSQECVAPNNPYDVGLAGLLGMPAGYLALQEADGILLLGTDFAYRQFIPEQARIVQIDKHVQHIGRRARVEVGLHGTVIETLAQLLPQLRGRPDAAHLEAGQQRHRADAAYLAQLATSLPLPGDTSLPPQHVAYLLNELAADNAVFTCDAGLPLLWAARYLHMNGHRRLLGSFAHGSVASALPQAMGVQLACPGRQVLALCSPDSLATLLGELLTLRQLAVPVKVILFNSSAGWAAPGPQAPGAPATGPQGDGPDFSLLAEAAGIKGLRVSDPAQLESALRETLAHAGPVVLDARIKYQALRVPPHLAAAAHGSASLYTLRAIVDGPGHELIDPARTEAVAG